MTNLPRGGRHRRIRAPVHQASEVHLRAFETHRADHLGEQLARRTDEGFAFRLFFQARGIADK